MIIPVGGLEECLWYHTLGETIVPRPALEADITADVCILGAGFSGLWTAYFLKKLQPELKVVVLDSGVAGEGASGRNGGWLMGSFSGDMAYLEQLDGDKRRRAKDWITGTVSRADALLSELGIECDFHHGGNLHVAARYGEQLSRLEAELAAFRAAGFDEADMRWLDVDEARAALDLPHTQGAIFTPHCARVQPLKLVRGLAAAVEAMGVSIFEHSGAHRLLSLPEHQVVTEKGSVKAGIVVSALEGYQRLLGLDDNTSLPVFSVLCATEPLSDSQWQQLGLADKQTFADASRLITYGQRSQDGRLVFGARGGYGFGGAVKTRFGFTPRCIGDKPLGDCFDLRSELLSALFPALNGIALTHGWGGCLALSRRFRPHALFDEQAGLAFIGGYGGEGVGASLLFGETLANLIVKSDSELTTMPWAFAGKISKTLKRWESEPLPWLGYSVSGLLYRLEDRLLSRSEPHRLSASVIRLADAIEARMQKVN